MKSDQAKQLFRIRAAWKMGRRQFGRPRSEARAKMWTSTFLLSPYFSRGPNGLFRARLVRERLLRRLQQIQSIAARYVTGARKYNYITPIIL